MTGYTVCIYCKEKVEQEGKGLCKDCERIVCRRRLKGFPEKGVLRDRR